MKKITSLFLVFCVTSGIILFQQTAVETKTDTNEDTLYKEAEADINENI